MSEAEHVDPSALRQVARWILEARRVLCITGAGVSAESGLPTYRGVGGIYEDQDTDDGIPIELALSAQVFRKDPALTWRYLLQICLLYTSPSPRDATLSRMPSSA